MTKNEHTFWFPAKKFGWGWGMPKCWQGWLVLALYALLLILSAARFLPGDNVLAFVGCAAALTIVLVLICWLKGEKSRWRWGD